jgi:hypothetical protein
MRWDELGELWGWPGILILLLLLLLAALCKGTLLFDYYSGFDFRRAITDPIANSSEVTWRVASFSQV